MNSIINQLFANMKNCLNIKDFDKLIIAQQHIQDERKNKIKQLESENINVFHFQFISNPLSNITPEMFQEYDKKSLFYLMNLKDDLTVSFLVSSPIQLLENITYIYNHYKEKKMLFISIISYYKCDDFLQNIGISGFEFLKKHIYIYFVPQKKG